MKNTPIPKAFTLSSEFYHDQELFRRQLEEVFARSWQYLGDKEYFQKSPYNAFPITLMEGSLSEPLLLTKSDEGLKLMSNVCTHRAFILVETPVKMRRITCGYHGRRFDHSGKCEYMPEFKEVENFPAECDHLTTLSMASLDRFLFTSITDNASFDNIHRILMERLYFMDFSHWRRAEEYDQTYNIRAHWALYVDNYLEGFHIPFVHQTLGAMIDYGTYSTICQDEVVLQIGYSDKGTPYFDLPTGHPDEGQKITAYYYWVYPNFMMNIYPWGVQLNVIKPMDKDYTKVDFLYFIRDENIWQRMGKDRVAEKTEREDEYVVEGVQKGLKSRYYNHGRYSVSRETGLYHFHSLVRQAMNID